MPSGINIVCGVVIDSAVDKTLDNPTVIDRFIQHFLGYFAWGRNRGERIGFELVEAARQVLRSP